MNLKRVFTGLLLAAVLLGWSVPESLGQERPRNVILFISDGCGPASFTMARDYVRDHLGGERLALDALQVGGGVNTFASNSRVTDSAASGTAYACAIKTYNGAIAVDTLKQPVATLLEAAEAAGMATGLVATSTITPCNPGFFFSTRPEPGHAS